MDKLREVIHTLTPEDQKAFRVFINKQRKKDKRKDLMLFRILQSETRLPAARISHTLYGHKNLNAYHSLRKRLMRQLTDFIVVKRLEEDTTAASPIMGTISLAQYLFDKKSDELAWNVLRNAEKQAVQNEQYLLLNGIYNLQVEHAHSPFSDDLHEIIRKRRSNKKLADEDENVNEAYSLIQQKLNEVRLKGKDVDFDQISGKILRAYDLQEIVTQRPRLLYQLLSISRSSILAKKDFYHFEPFIIGQYHHIEDHTGFSRKDHYYKLSMLYMIAHTLYRNRKFKQAIGYLDRLHQNLQAYHQSYYPQFYPRYIQLLAAVNAFSGDNKKAIDLLQTFLDEEPVKLSQSHGDHLNIILNLCIYYYQQDNIEASHRALANIYHTDKWCEKVMGKEWVLKKLIIETLLQYEMGNEEIVLYRIRNIERSFQDLFRIPRYRQAKIFLGFIRQMIHQPHRVRTEEFYGEVRSSFEFVPTEREDIQAMGFYAWLKAKMLNLQYYEVLLELMHRQPV